MHNAPSVTYPVGRSRWGAALLALAWLAGVAVVLQWSRQDGVGAGPAVVAWAGVAGVGLAAARAWWRGPSGALAWDGANWRWEAGPPGRVQVGLDLQAFLLVHWRAAGGARWLWLERAACPERWDDLRRAVYSRARPQALPVAEPPAAKP
jgi:hypothetical protein